MSSSEDDLEIPEYRIWFSDGTQDTEGINITPLGSRDQSPENQVTAADTMSDEENNTEALFKARRTAKGRVTRERKNFFASLDRNLTDKDIAKVILSSKMRMTL